MQVKVLFVVKELIPVCPVLSSCKLRFLFIIKNKFLFLRSDVNCKPWISTYTKLATIPMLLILVPTLSLYFSNNVQQAC